MKGLAACVLPLWSESCWKFVSNNIEFNFRSLGSDQRNKHPGELLDCHTMIDIPMQQFQLRQNQNKRVLDLGLTITLNLKGCSNLQNKII